MYFDAQALLWLLLPLAAASGWFVAKLDQRRKGPRYDLPSAYFKGLNFLLNEQPDKAIEVFIRVLEVNSDTVETHLALGNLFRRRGEVERAIRIHQNLIARPSLDKAQRSQALLELGQDYLKAGLFDRAENLFLELAEVRAHSEQALRFLVNIYQQERDWDNAIASCRKLARLSGHDMAAVIAQYYCEEAEEAFTRGSMAQARDYVQKALGADRDCVRASILRGDIEAREGRHKEAIKAWQHIEVQDPQYLSEVAVRLSASFLQLGDEEGMYAYFDRTLQRHGNIALMLAMSDALQRRSGVAVAEDFVVRWLRRQPSIHGLHRLIQLNLAEAQGESREDLHLLEGLLEKLMEQQRGYACQQCGFRGKSLHWQCPGCNRWNTVKPIAEVSLD